VSSLSTALLRPLIVRTAEHPWFRWLATRTPPGKLVASRFVAGETLDEAMRAARTLDRLRTSTMLDHLGENVGSATQAVAARDAYLAALDRVAAEDGLDCGVSVKLTQLGLDLSSQACLENLVPIAEAADRSATPLMVDMEGHVYVDATLEIVAKVHAQHPRVGVCLQSYLLRTADDVFALPPAMRIRLVKGSYLEPSEIVYSDKREVDLAYARLFVTLLARGHPIDVATHDPVLIEGVRRRVDAVEHGWSRVELQMLYGVRPDLQAELAGNGYPVRVYVPYGTEWYPYLTRRLAERPANLWFFLSNLARGLR
jgi:proline dehydrogenase